MSRQRTPAQLYALLVGVVVLVVGVLGFIADATFGAGSDVDGSDFIIFEVNGWHNIVYILSGLLGLALWRTRRARGPTRSASAPSISSSPTIGCAASPATRCRRDRMPFAPATGCSARRSATAARCT